MNATQTSAGGSVSDNVPAQTGVHFAFFCFHYSFITPSLCEMSKKLEPQADVPTEDRIDGKQLWMATDALSKAKAMRNYFQLERDKINAFWEITKREIESVKAALRNKDREKAEMTERHQVEMKVYKQKIRHILYEHKVHIANMKMEAERALKNKQEEHRLKEEEVRTDRQDIKRCIVNRNICTAT